MQSNDICDYCIYKNACDRGSDRRYECSNGDKFKGVEVEPHQWIPVTWHEADEEEKESCQWWFDEFGDDEPLYIFDCPIPDDEQDVLITSKWGNVYSVRALWNGYGFIGDEDGNEWENDVIAWMPLPKPYKKDGDE